MKTSIATTYTLMMVATGATIGAVSGLSNTSVTNTLIELILVFVSGSAGLYYINKKALQKEKDALNLIGIIGLLFLGSFWIAYLPASLYRYSGPDEYKWNTSLSDDANLALAEIYGHAQRLGISKQDLRKALARHVSTETGANTCRLTQGDPKPVSQSITAVYEAVKDCVAYKKPVMLSADYLAEQFRAVSNSFDDDPSAEKKAAATGSFERAIASLIALSRNHPEIGKPSASVLCKRGSGADPYSLAVDLEQNLQGCSGSSVITFLLAVRGHARAYEMIWKQKVSTEPAKAPGTPESLLRKGE